MRMCLRAWLFKRRHLYIQPRRLVPRVLGHHLLAPLRMKLLLGWPGNPPWRRGPQTGSLVGRRCYITPNPWWLPGRSPLHQEAQDWGLAAGEKGWFESLKLKNWRWQPPCRGPLAYTRVGSHLVSDATSQFSGSNSMSEGGPVSRRGLWGTPRPVDDRTYVDPWSGDHECTSYCEGWADRGHLHGHCNHLSGESGPQWPWTEDLSQRAYNTGHNGPHLHLWADKSANDHLWAGGL